MLHNWWETAEHNLEMIDGFEELPEDAQKKVQTALELQHVDDEDWNGVCVGCIAIDSHAY